MEKLVQLKKLLVYIMCLVAFNTYAQDTIKKTNSIGKFDEQFMVLKSDKKVKQGSYRLYTEKKLVASGSYDHGKRAGVWNFYDNDILEQQYDYTANKLILNLPSKAITCEVENTSPSDSVKRAVKIGGFNGFMEMIASTTFDSNVSEGGRNMITHLITLDETGQVKSWSAMVKSSDGLKVVNQSIAEAPVELALFLPAMVNGKPVASILKFNSEMNGRNVGDEKNDQGKPNMRGRGSGRRGGRG